MDAQMTDTILASLSAEMDRAARREPPTEIGEVLTVPNGRYIDSEFANLEQRHVWGKCWLYAGFDTEVPDVGSYKVIDRLPGAGVIIVRGKDNRIRAFYDTCRHRGGSVTGHTACGKAKMFSCTFHGWSYDLEGRLRNVPLEYDFPGLDKSEIGLRELRCEQLGSMIFVNKDDHAPPLQEWLGPLWSDFADLNMTGRTPFASHTYRMRCNWKAAHEAFVESYHLPSTHAKTVAGYVEYQASHILLYPNGHSAMYNLIRHDDVANERNPHALEGTEETRINRETIRQYTIFPNIQCTTAENEFAFVMLWPVDPAHVVIDVIYTGPPDYDPDSLGAKQLVGVYEATVAEDVDNIEAVQRSFESEVNPFLRLSWMERRAYWLNEAIDRVIGEGAISPELRVRPLLQQYLVDPYTELVQT